MGRITRTPTKPKPEYPHNVTVLHTEVDQAWIWEEVTRIAGITGYKRRARSWASTAVAFDTKEKAVDIAR